jgi:hypothetical protein
VVYRIGPTPNVDGLRNTVSPTASAAGATTSSIGHRLGRTCSQCARSVERHQPAAMVANR